MARLRDEVAGLRLPSPTQEITESRLDQAGVRLLLKRDDLIHPELPGNKWRKLEGNLEAARAGGHRRLLTFGGAYSNHLRALAAAGYHFGFDTVGVVRGEEHLPLNPSLAYATARGMRLAYLDRSSYRQKTDPDVIGGLRDRFGDFYLVPEGGSNALAVAGCTAIPAEVGERFDVICCPVGTGGTLAGIVAGLDTGQRAIGFSALKGGDFLHNDVARLLRDVQHLPGGEWRIETRYHFGGFARSTPQLDEFIIDFDRRHGILLERSYVAKMLFGVLDLADKASLSPGTVIVAVVTGPAGIPGTAQPPDPAQSR
jgi:1-aminocyclopropane-1-carboxylate deaminase